MSEPFTWTISDNVKRKPNRTIIIDNITEGTGPGNANGNFVIRPMPCTVPNMGPKTICKLSSTSLTMCVEQHISEEEMEHIALEPMIHLKLKADPPKFSDKRCFIYQTNEPLPQEYFNEIARREGTIGDTHIIYGGSHLNDTHMCFAKLRAGKPIKLQFHEISEEGISTQELNNYFSEIVDRITQQECTCGMNIERIIQQMIQDGQASQLIGYDVQENSYPDEPAVHLGCVPQ